MNTPSLPPISNSADDEIDLFDVWQTLATAKKSILLITLICFSIATVVAFVITPKYQGEILVAPADDGKGAGGLAALAGQFGGLAELAGVNLGGNGGNKETVIAYLTSKDLIQGFIKEKNLLNVLFASKWNKSAGKWDVSNQDEIPTLWDAYDLFSKKILTVNTDKKTGLITLSIEWKDREQAVNWANELVQRANSNLRQKAIAETERSLSFLEKELQKTSVVEVQQAIFKVMESQIKTKMMANVQEQFAFKVIDPATMMDEDAFVKPKRPLIILLGLICGLMLGIIKALIDKAIRNRRTLA